MATSCKVTKVTNQKAKWEIWKGYKREKFARASPGSVFFWEEGFLYLVEVVVVAVQGDGVAGEGLRVRVQPEVLVQLAGGHLVRRKRAYLGQVYHQLLCTALV